MLKSVASGEKPYGILVDFMASMPRPRIPTEFVFPSEGVPAVTEPVAIMATAKNVDGAKKFVDFILSDDGQKLALEQGYLPAKEVSVALHGCRKAPRSISCLSTPRRFSIRRMPIEAVFRAGGG